MHKCELCEHIVESFYNEHEEKRIYLVTNTVYSRVCIDVIN